MISKEEIDELKRAMVFDRMNEHGYGSKYSSSTVDALLKKIDYLEGELRAAKAIREMEGQSNKARLGAYVILVEKLLGKLGVDKIF